MEKLYQKTIENINRKSINYIINEETHNLNDTSYLFNSIYCKHKINKNLWYVNNKDSLVKNQVMNRLLKIMNESANMYINNLNSVNFIYQTYGKGINLINHKNIPVNKIQNVSNCMNQSKFYPRTNININRISSLQNNKIDFNKEEVTTKNKKKKFKIIIPFKRNNSCFLKKSNNINQKNFVLIPLKNIIFKKNIDKYNYNKPNTKRKKTPIIYKKKEDFEQEKEKEYLENLKLFSKKYEKEKEDFNNVLFDECIEFRKKKFKLESFIKRFSNRHFVEKLYKIKENALQKNQ